MNGKDLAHCVHAERQSGRPPCVAGLNVRLHFCLSAGLMVMGQRIDYDCIGRVTPSLAIRVSNVVGLSPRRSAAPPTPRMRQFVL